MAESRGSLLAKSVQKHAGRAKEKILQNLGKVDRTADDIFDDHLTNFNKQQNSASRLQKEFSNYIRCVRAAQAASKSFLEAVSEVYETSWSGHDLVYVQTQSVDMLYQDFCHKLGEQVLIPLNTYQNQFPEMKKKIDKRGRKLVDYDAQRHNYQTLQSGMVKKRDEAKLSKGRELLEEAKRTYEVLNSELHDELPALYDSRILFLVTNLQTLFNTEQIFHAETAKVYSELEAIVDKLATDSQRGSYSIKKSNGASLPRKIMNDNNTTVAMNSISPVKNNSTMPAEGSPDSPTTPTKPSTPPNQPSTPPNQPSTPLNQPSTPTTPITPNILNSGGDVSPNSSMSNSPPATLEFKHSAPATLEIKAPTPQIIPKPEPEITETEPEPKPKPEVNGNSTPQATDNKTVTENSTQNTTTKPKNVEELYDIPVGASTDNLPPGVLYRVKSTYKYNREDVDELSFDVGETIQVIEYDDPEEQEEGWLMGLKESTGEKGMFPANFTKPL